jgi:hypothetical protein
MNKLIPNINQNIGGVCRPRASGGDGPGIDQQPLWQGSEESGGV